MSIEFNESRALEYPLFEGDFGEPGDREMSDKISTARKQHTCVECLSPILAGERQRVHVGRYEGAMQTYRYCCGCCAAMAMVFHRSDDEDWCDPMEARAEIREHNRIGATKDDHAK